MAERRFRFDGGPRIQTQEIDNSQIPDDFPRSSPVIIGRFERGPSMRPVVVKNRTELINLFGNPSPGASLATDVWRSGKTLGPTYAHYAAMGYLKNSGPATIVRLLGTQHSQKNSPDGEAGWETKDRDGNPNGLGVTDAAGGAYGLFIIDSGSGDRLQGANPSPTTGALAAIWYLNEGSIVLTGTMRNSSGSATPTISGTAVLVESLGSNQEFRAIIRDKDGNVTKTTTFNFNINSNKYIRKVFNTNPTLTNLSISTGANTASYWLGPTFDRFLSENVSGSGAGANYGMILGLKGDAGTKEGGDFRFGAQAARTGWFFSQDVDSVTGSSNSYQYTSMTKLFRFHCLDTGEWTQQNIKISVQDIKASTNPSDPYGTFTVVLRRAQDLDNAIQVVERYGNVNLNPHSLNYIARRIGDKYVTWDDSERRFTEKGGFDNVSKFIRVEMNTDVSVGATAPELLPFGVFGPPRHIGFSVDAYEDAFQVLGTSGGGSDFSQAHVQGAGSIVRAPTTGSAVIHTGASEIAGGGPISYTGSFLFPAFSLRVSSSDGGIANPKDAYWGVSTTTSRTSLRFDPSYGDMVRALPTAYDSFDLQSNETEYSFAFSLDELSGSGEGLLNAVYNSGSRAAGTSLSAIASNNYKGVLDRGFDRFTSPLFGGFDGLDITEREPFNNTDLEGKTELNSYAYNSVKRAIDSVSDPEIADLHLAALPGITNESLTSHLLRVCEDRQDALAIIDLKGGFIPNTENTNGDESVANAGDVDTTIENLRQRGINSSYGCAYYPWVQIRDEINDAILWAPPSIVALGAMASAERKADLWFAPAGFNRGGLSTGDGGVPVVGVREKLTSKQRDKLYDANINPIAKFPAEGIVIFGQKTLQVTRSALDRINVRRLLLFVKKEISRLSRGFLFEPNVAASWSKWKAKAVPFLRSIKTRFGLQDFKVVLDETTTTPDLIDRNALYAKVLLKPTRTIEYIALDFIVTNTGASFTDEG